MLKYSRGGAGLFSLVGSRSCFGVLGLTSSRSCFSVLGLAGSRRRLGLWRLFSYKSKRAIITLFNGGGSAIRAQ
jgi:hypothetical protein